MAEALSRDAEAAAAREAGEGLDATPTPHTHATARELTAPQMFITKKNRIAIYSYLFKEGVVVCPKSLLAESPVTDVRNLEVVKAMQSLKTRGFVRENFTWQHHIFYLTDEGIQYLRNFLHLPEEIVPATLKQRATARPEGARRPAEEGKEGGAGGDFKPAFRRDGPPPRRDFGARAPRA